MGISVEASLSCCFGLLSSSSRKTVAIHTEELLGLILAVDSPVLLFLDCAMIVDWHGRYGDCLSGKEW